MVSFPTSRALLLCLTLALLASTSHAYSVSPSKDAVDKLFSSSTAPLNRRSAFQIFVSAAAGSGAILSSSTPALASGGATAGKYT